jgi:hypothetical protein
MERNPFYHRCQIKMDGLGLTQEDVAGMVGKPRPKITEALRGDKTPAAASLRVTIDQTLTRLVGEKRKKMAEELRKAAAVQAPHLKGEISLILPEDVNYIVLEDGVPVGLWIPETGIYKEFPPSLGM